MAFSSNKSPLYMPLVLGFPPINKAASTSVNPKVILNIPFFKSSVHIISLKSGNAQSPSYMATPVSAFCAWGISMRWRITGWSRPSISPLAILNKRE